MAKKSIGKSEVVREARRVWQFTLVCQGMLLFFYLGDTHSPIRDTLAPLGGLINCCSLMR